MCCVKWDKELRSTAARLVAERKYADAEALLEQTVVISEKFLGPDHPGTAEALTNLADIHRLQNRYAKAEPLYQRALAIYSKSLSDDEREPQMAVSLESLANFYAEQGKYAEAQAAFSASLTMWGQGWDSCIARINVAIANACRLQHKYDEAEQHFTRASEILEVISVKDCYRGQIELDLVAADYFFKLAMLYSEQKKYAESKRLLERVLATIEKWHGPNHLHATTALSSLADLHRAEGNADLATTLYRRVLAICMKDLGPADPHTAYVRNKLGAIDTDADLLIT